MQNYRRIFKILITVSSLFSLAICFNNCARLKSARNLGKSSLSSFQGFATNNSANAVCDGQLKAAFQRTYYPFLMSNCNSCHAQAHGSRDINVAFEAFQKKGDVLIDYQATHAHGGNNFSLAMQSKLDAFKPSWNQAEDAYQVCLAQAANQNGGSFVKNLRLVDKSQITGLANTANNTNSWVSIQWDLETEVLGGNTAKFAAYLKVEARLNKDGGAVDGIMFRNPSMRLKSGSENIEVSGIMIALDGQIQKQVTTFSGVSKIVAGTSDNSLVGNSGAAYAVYANISDATKISLQIDEIAHTLLQPDASNGPQVGPITAFDIPDIPIPTGGVTFTQLITSNSVYRVFDRSCAGCHNSGGVFDIKNYDVAVSKASLIIQRMNSATNPMPPSGLLKLNDRDLVKSWVNAGTPK
jgi:mono/diheme cytochrome c family protein